MHPLQATIKAKQALQGVGAKQLSTTPQRKSSNMRGFNPSYFTVFISICKDFLSRQNKESWAKLLFKLFTSDLPATKRLLFCKYLPSCHLMPVAFGAHNNAV